MKAPKPLMADESVALSLFIDAMFRDAVPEKPIADQQVLQVDADAPLDAAEALGEQISRGDVVSVVGFVIGSYRLAVPLEDISGIIRRPDKLDTVPGLPAWIPGVARERDRLVRVVNMHGFFDECPQVEASGGSDSRILIIGRSVDGLAWGLACQCVSEVVKAGPDDLIWSKKNSQRPWLAATVLTDMSLLLDPGAMCREFDLRAGISA